MQLGNAAAYCRRMSRCNETLNIEGILPKGPYLSCVSMAARALLAGYPRYLPRICPGIKCNICIESRVYLLYIQTYNNVYIFDTFVNLRSDKLVMKCQMKFHFIFIGGKYVDIIFGRFVRCYFNELRINSVANVLELVQFSAEISMCFTSWESILSVYFACVDS